MGTRTFPPEKYVSHFSEIEVRETYMDGWRSQQGIIEDLRAANADLQRLVTS